MIRPLARRQSDTEPGWTRHAFDSQHAAGQRHLDGRPLSVGLSMCGVDVVRVVIGESTDFEPDHPDACVKCATALGLSAAHEPGWRGGDGGSA